MTMAPTEDRSDWDELAEYLHNLCAFAKRQPAVVAKSYTDRPTAWDKAHQRINAALDDIETAAKPCA